MAGASKRPGLVIQSVGGAVRSRAWARTSASTRSPPPTAPAALVREDAFDIALPEEARCVRTYDDMVTLVQERVETRQLAAD